MFFSLASSILFIAAVNALSTGAPICDITSNGGFKNSAHGDNAGATGYSISLSSTDLSAGPITVTVSGGTFQGLLLYAQTGNNPAHLGQFSGVAGQFQYQTSCAAQNIAGSAQSTVTHTSSDAKTTASFQWSPVAGDVGKFVFKAVVATGGPGTPYAIIESQAITLTGGNSAKAAGNGNKMGQGLSAKTPATPKTPEYKVPKTTETPVKTETPQTTGTNGATTSYKAPQATGNAGASPYKAPQATSNAGANPYKAPQATSNAGTKKGGYKLCPSTNLRKRSLRYQKYLEHVREHHNGNPALHRRAVLTKRAKLTKRALTKRVVV
ncbi:MAG: hypothetical protein SGCHY_001213 [Lobulomycetales sp.]